MARHWGIAKLPETLTLKCDNPICGHEITGIPHKLMPGWIGHACPACGVNMLTEKDYLDLQRLFRVVAWCNKWLGWLGLLFSKREDVEINPHHSELNIKRKDAE